jgi:hypothetical protein
MTAGIIVAFAGYALASYGWVLLQGWDITLRQWMSPLHPYQFPASGKPATVADVRVFPAGTA